MGIDFRNADADHSPLDVAEQMFQLLGGEPGGLALDATGLTAELPQRPILLPELRDLLMDRRLGNHVRDVIWRSLVAHARQEGPAWLVGAVGVALPALRLTAERITSGHIARDAADVDGEVLTLFVEAIRTADLDAGDVRPHLCDAARQGSRYAHRVVEPGSCRRLPYRAAAPPQAPWKHPDLVLFDAVVTDTPGTAGTTATARSRSSSDAHSGHHDSKGGSGTASGSVRSTTPLPSSDGQAEITMPATAAVSANALPGAADSSVEEGPPDRPPIPPWLAWVRQARQVLIVTTTVALLVAFAATAVLAESDAITAAAPSSPDQLGRVFDNLRTWLISLLTTLATLMLTIGGLRYLIAGGDPGEVQKAKAALKAAALGYALAVLAPLFVNVLKRVVGG
ncbi:hypothetical protein ACFY19_21055 [Streptosporangium saharense]|uniref:hypothetical protein n=1 Tax=Streptosporangium saharense TaxID=1706840 RepID=UPI00368FCFEA